ncbi:MAG: hypothetical protein RR240_11955 [Burkholderiaceae bacterium]
MLWLIAPVLSLLVLAAHFYRASVMPLAALSIAVAFLLLVPRAWAARAVQIALLLGALEWLRTLASLAAERMSWDQPWLRMAAILGVVALLTAASALVFRARRLREQYRLK